MVYLVDIASTKSPVKKSFILITCVCFFQHLHAQDSAIISRLLYKIALLQKTGDPSFSKGVFPSYISSQQKFSASKKDNNIFFNGLIFYTLQQLKPQMNKSQAGVLDEMLSYAAPAFGKFKNREGRDTWNFWRTDTVQKFPYGTLLGLLNKDYALPDDMDDTVLSLMAQNADSTTAAAVHKLMQSYTNNGKNKFRNIISELGIYPAYSTWFGKKFPVVFDVSVLCNVLNFAEQYHLTWTNADSASLAVIIYSVVNDHHITQPLFVSPYYGKTSLILYHIARLMHNRHIPELEKIKTKLVTDAATELALTKNKMEQILLSTALLKWGYIPPPVNCTDEKTMAALEKNDLPFFIGNIPSYLPGVAKLYLTEKDKFLFYHYCPAYNNALLLEYLMLRNAE